MITNFVSSLNRDTFLPYFLTLPFRNAHDAMEFILKTPTLAAYGGYDPSTMSDETIVDFANEILQQLKLATLPLSLSMPIQSFRRKFCVLTKLDMRYCMRTVQIILQLQAKT